jgi:capsular exopolysaccharide synthesis family protein
MKELELPSLASAGYSRVPRIPHAQAAFEPAQPVVAPAHYLQVVWRQKWKIAAFIATCLLVTFLISSRMTPVYEATAKIDVDRRVPQSVVGQGASQGTVGDDSDAFMATQMELIQSDGVLRPVADHYDLLRQEQQLEKMGSENARKKTDAPVYLKQLKITRPISTYLLDISYRSPDPQLAADVANAIAQSYLEQTFNIRLKATGALSSFMEKQLEELKAKMERSSTALAKFERTLDVIDPENKTNILSARLLQLNTEYTAAQSERLRKEAAYHASRSGTVASAMISTQGEELTKLQDRVNQAKQRLADVASIYGPNHNEYRKAANDLAEVERQFTEAHAVVSQRVDADFQEAKDRENMLRKAVRSTKAEYDELNAHSFEYQQLKRDADADKALYDDLERRIREAGINAGFQNNSIRIADLARPPDSPVFPRTKLNLLLALIASMVVGICGAILADLLDNTIRDPEQVARALDTSVLGTLPTVKEMRRLLSPGDPLNLVEEAAGTQLDEPPSRSKVIRYKPATLEKKRKQRAGELALPTYENGFSAYEEAIRTLRHSILLPDPERSIRSLLITSAAPGEGKSTAIIHLAIAHAEQGKRTLIVDADLRRPSLHKKLGLNGSLGLSNVLLGEFHWKETVIKNDLYPNLELLPAGMASRRASDLVGSMMLDILEEASKEYDLILVDAPPLLGFAEAMQVAKSVDGVIVIALAGQTSRRAVATVLATLKQLRANVIGLALNEVDKNTVNGYYFYGNYRKYYASNERHG